VREVTITKGISSRQREQAPTSPSISKKWAPEENEPKGYSKPEFRSRDTGSITGTGSRLNSQRATTNPIAAYQTCTSFIKNPHERPFPAQGELSWLQLILGQSEGQ
jgi:hypothetical protein